MLSPRRLPLAAFVVTAACSAFSRPLTPQESRTELQRGEALLEQLLEDEQDVDKILWIKSVTEPTRELVEKIVEVSGSTLEALRQDEDPATAAMDPERALPPVEQATRDSIATKTTWDLLLSQETFEVRLLMCQGQALRYGRFLAESMAELTSSPAKKDTLARLGSSYEDLYKQVVERLVVRQ